MTESAKGRYRVITGPPLAFLQLGVAPEQAQNGLLGLHPGEVRAQAQVSTTTEGLMMGIFSFDIEFIGIRVDSRVSIGGRQQWTD